GFATDEFPAFYNRASGIPLLHRLDTAQDIATLIGLQRQLKMTNGIVIANSIPIEAEISNSDIKPFIQQAHNEAKHINGQSLTPAMIKRIGELTTERHREANIELIKHNANLGAQISIAHQENIKNFVN
ncbi:MAG: pseudouridine-5'-phosphate glycosidase, partial [bacterium]|nr:pseudouridine-5'-phosphate glycosidase [bacterium]